MLPNNKFEFNHYFKNFVPHHMTNFNRYYIFPEIYTLFGKIVPTYNMVIVVGVVLYVILIVSTMFMSNRKLVKGRKKIIV